MTLFLLRMDYNLIILLFVSIFTRASHRKIQKGPEVPVKGATKTKAYQKCGVDRKTIVDTSAIAELEACDITAYRKLRAEFQKGQKLSDFAHRCQQLCTQEPVCSAIEGKKWRANRHYTKK